MNIIKLNILKNYQDMGIIFFNKLKKKSSRICKRKLNVLEDKTG